MLIILGLIFCLQVIVICIILTIEKTQPQEPCRFKETQIPPFECKAAPHVCQFHEPLEPQELKSVLPTVEHGRRNPENVEILRKVNNTWTHYSWRPRDHKDLPAYLKATGFAIRYSDGTLDEGNQNV